MLETIIVAICFIIVIGVTGFALLYFRDNGTEEPQKTGKKHFVIVVAEHRIDGRERFEFADDARVADVAGMYDVIAIGKRLVGPLMQASMRIRYHSNCRHSFIIACKLARKDNPFFARTLRDGASPALCGRPFRSLWESCCPIVQACPRGSWGCRLRNG